MAKTTKRTRKRILTLAPASRAARQEDAPRPTTFASILSELAGAFETRKRSDGTEFVTLRDDAPDWTKRDTNGESLCLRLHRAVDDRAPDDWVYRAIQDMADKLTGYGCESATNLRETVSEAADGQCDIYSPALTKWLASHPYNAFLVDEAISATGWPSDRGIFGAIVLGQYRALEAIGNAIIDEVQAELERREGGE